MSMQVNQLWQIVLSDLGTRGKVPARDHRTYLQSTSLINLDRQQGKAIVGAPDSHIREELVKRYQEKIASSLGALIGRAVEVEFMVLNQATLPVSGDVAGSRATERPRQAGRVGTPARQAGRAPALQPLQLELPSEDGLNKRYVFDNFIVGPSNRLAHAASLAVADRPGAVYNPLFIYGGVGLGKTHLMHAIGHRAREHYGADLRVLYLTSERFTNELIGSIRTGKQEEFRDRYRSVDLLMIDDIQFIAGKDATQEEFFHTFNHLHQLGKHIILSSDRQPKAIATLDDRLRSRFEWGLIADVQPPDLETRIAILQQKGEESGVHVPREVLDYVAQQVQSNIRELEGTLNRIIAHAQLEGVSVTLALATGSMNDPYVTRKRKQLTIPRVLDVVADFYKLTTKDLTGKVRTKEIAWPRQVAMYLIRTELDNPAHAEIGKAFGGKDHSTVIHGIEKVKSEIARSPELDQELRRVREKLYADGPGA